MQLIVALFYWSSARAAIYLILTQRNMSTSSHVKGVIDLTFLDIKDESGIAAHIDSKNPNSLTLDASQVQTQTLDFALTENTGSSSGSPSRRKRKEEEIKALRLSNNQLTNMDALYAPIKASTLLRTDAVLWLDLSFNQLTNISDHLPALFPNLTTLYLQANNIKRISHVKKLTQLPHLKSLALYGNPCEEHKHYRNYVLYMCKGLTQFDASPVTSKDRERVEVWSQTFRKVLNPEDD